MKPEYMLLEGVVTVELYGYLAGLKLRPIEDTDLTEHTALDAVMFGVGLPMTAVEKIVVNGSLVSSKYALRPGDHVALYPLKLGN